VYILCYQYIIRDNYGNIPYDVVRLRLNTPSIEGIMTKKVMVEEYRLPERPTIIQQIKNYAYMKGLEQKNGSYYKNGKYAGSLYDIGREAGIDMQDGR
jgi:hypothetical protein